MIKKVPSTLDDLADVLAFEVLKALPALKDDEVEQAVDDIQRRAGPDFIADGAASVGVEPEKLRARVIAHVRRRLAAQNLAGAEPRPCDRCAGRPEPKTLCAACADEIGAGP